MTKSELRFHIAKILECAPDSLDETAGIGEHTRWDSMAHVQIMIFLNEHFSIEISDDTIKEFSNYLAIEKLAN